jgi:hypothetical protein
MAFESLENDLRYIILLKGVGAHEQIRDSGNVRISLRTRVIC